MCSCRRVWILTCSQHSERERERELSVQLPRSINTEPLVSFLFVCESENPIFDSIQLQLILSDVYKNCFLTSFRHKKNFSLLNNTRTESKAHPASYRMGTEDDFPGDKAIGA
jgi:hypothetical protein